MGESTRVWLYSDGGSRGNPGPAAIAFVIYDAEGAVLREHAECIGSTTNNVAEYMSLIQGLEVAQRLGATHIVAVSDSLLLVNQLNGTYKVKAAHLRELRDDVMMREAMFESVAHQHVNRSDPRIALADQLLNHALDSCRKHADRL